MKKLSQPQVKLYNWLSRPSCYIVRNEHHSMLCPLFNCFGHEPEIETYFHRSTVDALIKRNLLKLTDKPNMYKLR